MSSESISARLGMGRSARLLLAFATLIAILSAFIAPAVARTKMPSSQKVALVQSNGPVPPSGQNGLDGIMPISSYVSGRPGESFGKFSFTDLPITQVTPATLSRFDTVALIQIPTGSLPAAARAALAQFVANGGKLLIHDADETHLNDYGWLLPGSHSTKVGASCNSCGASAGTSAITQSSGLISPNPGDPAYVDIAELARYTDAIGDANLLVSDDPRWFAAARGTDGANEAGAQVAYATHNGLIIYNGFDTDFIKPLPSAPWRCLNPPAFSCPNGHPSVDWLAQMWYDELNLGWSFASNALPPTNPVAGIGTNLTPAQAGLPSNRRCMAHRRLRLALTRLTRHHRRIVEVDVYVNGRRVLRERGRVHDVTLTRLPRKGKYVVKIIAITKRRYHLIAKQRYTAC